MKTILTIDPGASGGIAYFANQRIHAVKMPKTVPEINNFLKYVVETHGDVIIFIEKVQAYRGKNVDDLEEVFLELYSKHKDPKKLFQAFQEESSGEDDAPGKKFGINKMLNNYSELLTIVKLLEIHFVEIYPISWQTTLGLKFKKPKGMSDPKFKTFRKSKYKEYASNSFPEINKVTLAISDALCLVQFALVKMKADPKWIKERTQGGPGSGFF